MGTVQVLLKLLDSKPNKACRDRCHILIINFSCSPMRITLAAVTGSHCPKTKTKTSQQDTNYPNTNYVELYFYLSILYQSYPFFTQDFSDE